MPTPATLRVERGRTILAGQNGRSGNILTLARSLEARPFLKWTGGKQWLASVADALLPQNFTGRYYEPFVGGGSVFFGLGLPRAILSDACEDLIEAYIGVRDSPERVIALLQSYPYERDFFERLRRARPRVPHTRAARLIYLNKTAFNGMYRVNLKGEFNVPFGRYVNPTICDADRIRSASQALQGVKLRTTDFAAALRRVTPKDFVYLDPPYITGHRNNGFVKYNAPLFSWEDQTRLAERAATLKSQGTVVVVSNSDHDDVTSLYKGFFRYVVSRNSLIGGAGSTRGSVCEALLTSMPIKGIQTTRI